jgi:hypothetical protein
MAWQKIQIETIDRVAIATLNNPPCKFCELSDHERA